MLWIPGCLDRMSCGVGLGGERWARVCLGALGPSNCAPLAATPPSHLSPSTCSPLNPIRGIFTSVQRGAVFCTSSTTYIADHATASPEDQIIRGDDTSETIRALQRHRVSGAEEASGSKRKQGKAAGAVGHGFGEQLKGASLGAAPVAMSGTATWPVTTPLGCWCPWWEGHACVCMLRVCVACLPTFHGACISPPCSTSHVSPVFPLLSHERSRHAPENRPVKRAAEGSAARPRSAPGGGAGGSGSGVGASGSGAGTPGSRAGASGSGTGASGSGAGSGRATSSPSVPPAAQSRYTKLSLQAKTIRDLQAIMKAWALPVSGKKDDLIMRILDCQRAQRG